MLHHLRISWDEHGCDCNCNVTSPYLELSFNVASLNVSKLHYGDAGGILLSTFLYHNIHIQVLDISHNNISDYGAMAISESLQSNSFTETQQVP